MNSSRGTQSKLRIWLQLIYEGVTMLAVVLLLTDGNMEACSSFFLLRFIIFFLLPLDTPLVTATGTSNDSSLVSICCISIIIINGIIDPNFYTALLRRVLIR